MIPLSETLKKNPRPMSNKRAGLSAQWRFPEGPRQPKLDVASQMGGGAVSFVGMSLPLLQVDDSRK